MNRSLHTSSVVEPAIDQPLGRNRDAPQLFTSALLADSDSEPISDLSSTNTIVIRELLEQLIVYLETNNWQAEDCLEQVRRQLNGHYAQDLEMIYNYVVDLEFSKAIEYVKKLQEALYESQ